MQLHKKRLKEIHDASKSKKKIKLMKNLDADKIITDKRKKTFEKDKHGKHLSQGERSDRGLV